MTCPGSHGGKLLLLGSENCGLGLYRGEYHYCHSLFWKYQIFAVQWLFLSFSWWGEKNRCKIKEHSLYLAFALNTGFRRQGVTVPILRLKYWGKAEISPFSHRNNWNVPRCLAILNPAFFDLLRPSLVHVLLSFLSTRILKKFSRVQVAPEIKASFKEQRSRRRAPIKMVKTFNFYLGILVRTRVYTNTDLMGLSVCVLYFFFLFFLTFSFTFI